MTEAALTPFVRASIGLHGTAAALALAAPHFWPWALGAVALDQAVLTGAGMWPQSTLLGANLRRLPPTGRAEVALTFDDGPDPTATPAVLDLLEAHGARATFFCVGRAAMAQKGLAQSIARRGHAVENHSDRHRYAFACLPPAMLRRDILAAQQTLADLSGTPPMFFRAPMGLRSPLLQPVLAAAGLHLASWTRRALDGVRCDPARARARLLRGLAAGDILLMHDSARNGAAVRQVLPAVLDACARAGLRCVTLRQGIAA